MLDEVAVHDRSLAPQEIAYIYSAGQAGLCDPPPAHDAGVAAIVAPADVVGVQTTVIPQVTVINPGAAAESIPVTLEIGADYSNTVAVPLGPAEATTVSFPAWSADPIGSREVRAFTTLPGDLDPANDTLSRVIEVVTSTPTATPAPRPMRARLGCVLPLSASPHRSRPAPP